MADTYVNALIAAGKIAEAAYVSGARTITAIATKEFVAGDAAGDVFRFFKSLNPNLIPIDIKIYADDALVGADDVNVGLYETTDDGGTGVVVDDNCFGDDIDLSPAGGAVRGGGADGTDEWVDGMKAVDVADMEKKIYEHGAHTVATYKQGYDLALTVVSEITTGGTVTVVAQFIEG